MLLHKLIFFNFFLLLASVLVILARVVSAETPQLQQSFIFRHRMKAENTFSTFLYFVFVSQQLVSLPVSECVCVIVCVCVCSALTPAPQLALGGHEEAVGGAGSRHHAAHLDVVQAAVTVRTPQVLTQVTESSWRHKTTTTKLNSNVWV